MIETPAASAPSRVGDRLAQQLARGGHGLGLEVGDLLPEHGNEIAHDVNDGLLDAEQVGVQIALGDAVADLAGQAGVELVLGDRFEKRAAVVGLRRLQIGGHVHGLRGDRHLEDLLPKLLKYGPPGAITRTCG